MSERTHFGYEEVSPDEKTRRVRGVFESVASRYDLMNDLMSGGLHRAWKRFAVALSGVREGSHVLDLAGGTGDLARLYAKAAGASGMVVLTAACSRMKRSASSGRSMPSGTSGPSRSTRASVSARCARLK